jgi:hypothetical protein
VTPGQLAPPPVSPHSQCSVLLPGPAAVRDGAGTVLARPGPLLAHIYSFSHPWRMLLSGPAAVRVGTDMAPGQSASSPHANPHNTGSASVTLRSEHAVGRCLLNEGAGVPPEQSARLPLHRRSAAPAPRPGLAAARVGTGMELSQASVVETGECSQIDRPKLHNPLIFNDVRA